MPDQRPTDQTPTRRGSGRALIDGAGITLVLIGWALFLAGILAGVALERWVL